MKKSPSCYWFIGLVLSVIVLFPNRICAKEIEIVVSGPWAFTDDPFNSGHIVLIVVNEEHEVHLMGGDSIYIYWNSLGHFVQVKAGYYSFDFPTQCSGTPSSDINPYPVTGVSNIQSRINSSSRDKRIAISVPKPCWYSQVQPSRVILGEGEKSFTTIMKLHYTVEDTIQAARVSSNGDHGETLATAFNFRTAGNGYQDVALVAGSTKGNFDEKCDHHSADIFDRSFDFWGQSRVQRLFPGVDKNTGQQTKYDFTCTRFTGRGNSGPAIAMSQIDVKNGVPDVPGGDKNPSRTDCHAPQLMITGTAK